MATCSDQVNLIYTEVNVKMSTVYFFFAPPRSGNHWIEMMLAGLYNISPIFLTDEQGDVLPDLYERYGKSDPAEIVKERYKPYTPEITKDNPILFLEYGQEISNEVIDRAKEIDLDVVRSIVRSCEIGRNTKTLHVQWFHGNYHVHPFIPEVGGGIDTRFWCVKRSPQAIAYSLLKVKRRWSKYQGKTDRKRTFLDVYTERYLREIFSTYQFYDELAKSYPTSILYYEELLKSEKPLVDLIDNCVQQESKLSAHFVWRNSQFEFLTKNINDRSFYRKGSAYDWLTSLTNEELKQVNEIEQRFDFSSIGYPRTKDVQCNQKRRHYFLKNIFKK